jgi:ADP-ribosyl-[dinitrogen reductase] hydrolase
MAGGTSPSVTERARACLIGGALGDGIGWGGGRIEFCTDPAEIGRLLGAGEAWQPLRTAAGEIEVSDDTQMTLFSLAGLMDALADGITDADGVRERVRDAYLAWYATQGHDGRFQPGTTAASLAADRRLRARRAPGGTCLSALAGGGHGRVDTAVNDSKGCGGVMRVAPFGLIERFSPEEAFEHAAHAAAITHTHPSGYLSAGAMAALVRLLLDGADPRSAVRHVLALTGEWQSNVAPVDRYRHETVTAIEAALSLADRVRAGEPHAPALLTTHLGEGWTGEQALAIGLYAVLVADSFPDAIGWGAMHRGDSDSTASLAGQLWGAWRGFDTMPDEWIAALDVHAPLTLLLDRLPGWP